MSVLMTEMGIPDSAKSGFGIKCAMEDGEDLMKKPPKQGETKSRNSPIDKNNVSSSTVKQDDKNSEKSGSENAENKDCSGKQPTTENATKKPIKK